jgi:hypothetical protein
MIRRERDAKRTVHDHVNREHVKALKRVIFEQAQEIATLRIQRNTALAAYRSVCRFAGDR